jgi:Sulfocyanin (SoxE) domain
MPRPMRPFVTAAILALASSGSAAVATAQTQSSPDSSKTASASAPGDTATPDWLVTDPAGKTVTIALQVTRASDGGALINGHRKGGLQIVVPLNWTVQWDWRNADSTAPHSLVVMVEREKLPTEGGRASFTNAMSRSVTAGLPAGQGDRTTFTADEAGWYWLLCGVPSHALNGEYLGLRVDPEAKAATVKQK